MSPLAFTFADTDSHSAELSELYSYSEIDEFGVGFDTFLQYAKDNDVCVISCESL
jgi:hypothetical protein